jgi:hypothetical protein
MHLLQRTKQIQANFCKRVLEQPIDNKIARGFQELGQP